MSRVILEVGEQSAFLEEAREGLLADWDDIAEICGVHKRTLFDWRREKYQMTLSALERLSAVSGVPKPKNLKVLEGYWYTHKGGKEEAVSRNKIYGNPGTPEGRRKGAWYPNESGERIRSFTLDLA